MAVGPRPHLEEEGVGCLHPLLLNPVSNFFSTLKKVMKKNLEFLILAISYMATE